MRLTDISIRKLKQPERGQKVHFDDGTPGFGIRVSKRYKSFVVYFGDRDNRRFKTLGRYPEVSLQDARKEAKIFLNAQPSVVSTRSKKYPDAVSEFLEDCLNRNRPSTAKSYKHYLSVYKTKKRIGDITRPNLKNHLTIYKGRDSAYSHALTTFKVFFNWCIQQELIDKHPIAGEKSIAVPARDRVLSIEELHQIYEYENGIFSNILKLCILTGQRRSEIAAIHSSWIEEDSITFPSEITKNGRTHTIPLTARSMKLLDGEGFLFSSKEGSVFNGWSRSKRRIDQHVEIPHWVIHDLRRSFATIHAQIATPIHITERLLNHSSGVISGVAAVYNRHTYLDEMRDAMIAYEDHIFGGFASN